MERSWSTEVELFQYPGGNEARSPLLDEEIVVWPEEGSKESNDTNVLVSTQDMKAAHELFEERLEDEKLRSYAEGREQGILEGRRVEKAAQSAALADRERCLVAKGTELVEGFAKERDRYLKAVEEEVVKLSLAIASRILRREAQMDPLLLSGAVRVALGQLAKATTVRLHVPEDHLQMWKEAIALVPNLPVLPEIIATSGLQLGDCTIEAELGLVDIGIQSQLTEIQRGFFDQASLTSNPAGVCL